jgi:hypothetical protein
VKVQTRNPRFKVRIVTHDGTELTFESLKGAIRSITITKRIGEAGAFQLELVPRRQVVVAGRATSFHDLIPLMSYVEVFCWVPPREPKIPLLRGWVDTVGETFDISSGTPGRRLIVAGRDYTKLAMVSSLYYHHDQLDDPTVLPLAILQQLKDGLEALFSSRKTFVPDPADPSRVVVTEPSTPVAIDAPPPEPDASQYLTPVQMQRLIFSAFYASFQDELVAAFPGDVPKARLAIQTDAWEDALRTYSPLATLRNFAPYTDVWTLMRSYQHAPWRELFVEEDADGPMFVYRPAPWLSRVGLYVQTPGGATVPTPGAVEDDSGEALVTVRDVSRDDLVASDVVRSDQYVLNFFLTLAGSLAAYAMAVTTYGTALQGMQSGDPFKGNPYLVGLGAPKVESSISRHGLRRLDATTPFFDADTQWTGTVKQQKLAEMREQGLIGNLRLVRAFDHMGLLETGELILKGDERWRLGDYVRLSDGPTAGARYYVEGVGHSFRQASHSQDGHFLTTLSVGRGRGHLVRTGNDPSVAA